MVSPAVPTSVLSEAVVRGTSSWGNDFPVFTQQELEELVPGAPAQTCSGASVQKNRRLSGSCRSGVHRYSTCPSSGSALNGTFHPAEVKGGHFTCFWPVECEWGECVSLLGRSL